MHWWQLCTSLRSFFAGYSTSSPGSSKPNSLGNQIPSWTATTTRTKSHESCTLELQQRPNFNWMALSLHRSPLSHALIAELQVTAVGVNLTDGIALINWSAARQYPHDSHALIAELKLITLDIQVCNANLCILCYLRSLCGHPAKNHWAWHTPKAGCIAAHLALWTTGRLFHRHWWLSWKLLPETGNGSMTEIAKVMSSQRTRHFSEY